MQYNGWYIDLTDLISLRVLLLIMFLLKNEFVSYTLFSLRYIILFVLFYDILMA